jgi:hypothetical protein
MNRQGFARMIRHPSYAYKTRNPDARSCNLRLGFAFRERQTSRCSDFVCDFLRGLIFVLPRRETGGGLRKFFRINLLPLA